MEIIIKKDIHIIGSCKKRVHVEMTNSLRNASAYIFVDTSRYPKIRSLPMNQRIKTIQQLFEHTQRSELNNQAKDNNNPDSYLNT